jgi:peptidoglycan/xylan/chitin deacetylase (PgdA/CDA1 family)
VVANAVRSPRAPFLRLAEGYRSGLMPPVAILSYHKIGEPPDDWYSWYYVSRARFREDLNLLQDLGWTTIDHTTLIDALDRPDRLRAPSVLITFDDAYASLVREALPVLSEAGAPAVVFVPTVYIGGMNTFDAGEEPDEPICSRQDLATLAEHGVSIQSHGAHHAAMSDLAPHEQRSELEESRRELEAVTGGTVDLFAFPYGDAGTDRRAMADAVQAAGYRAAFGYGGGPADLTADDRYCLPRLAMGPDTDLAALLA